MITDMAREVAVEHRSSLIARTNQTRVILYVDGFNLNFGVRSKGWRKYYWLDLPALGTSLLEPDQQLVKTHYFTSRIRVTTGNADDARRQNNCIDALVARGVNLQTGQYLEKKRTCRQVLPSQNFRGRTRDTGWVEYGCFPVSFHTAYSANGARLARTMAINCFGRWRSERNTQLQVEESSGVLNNHSTRRVLRLPVEVGILVEPGGKVGGTCAIEEAPDAV